MWDLNDFSKEEFATVEVNNVLLLEQNHFFINGQVLYVQFYYMCSLVKVMMWR